MNLSSRFKYDFCDVIVLYSMCDICTLVLLNSPWLQKWMLFNSNPGVQPPSFPRRCSLLR